MAVVAAAQLALNEVEDMFEAALATGASGDDVTLPVTELSPVPVPDVARTR